MDETSQKAIQLLELSYRLFDGQKPDEKSDIRYYMLLLDEFMDINIEDEFIQYYAWTLDNPSSKRTGFRCGFRNWLKRTAKMT